REEQRSDREDRDGHAHVSRSAACARHRPFRLGRRGNLRMSLQHRRAVDGIRRRIGRRRPRSHSKCETVRKAFVVRIPAYIVETRIRNRRLGVEGQRFAGWHNVVEARIRNRRLGAEGQWFAGWHKFRGMVSRVLRSETCSDRRSGRIVVDNLADETKAALVHGANEALIVAAVAYHAPCGADARAQRGLRDDAALPNHIEQLVLADDPVAVTNEVNEQIEHLRLDVDDRAGTPQLMARNVDLAVGESEVHICPRRTLLDRRRATTCQIAIRYRPNYGISAANLQTDSREYQVELKLAVKLVIRTAA